MHFYSNKIIDYNYSHCNTSCYSIFDELVHLFALMVSKPIFTFSVNNIYSWPFKMLRATFTSNINSLKFLYFYIYFQLFLFGRIFISTMYFYRCGSSLLEKVLSAVLFPVHLPLGAKKSFVRVN